VQSVDVFLRRDTARMKAFLTWLIVAALFACGGDNTPVVINEIYDGALIGRPCFSPFPDPTSVPIHFTVTRGPNEGDAVSLVDQGGTSWAGTMTSANSFAVKIPQGDQRMSIIANDITEISANVILTSCATFRCCAQLTGAVQIKKV